MSEIGNSFVSYDNAHDPSGVNVLAFALKERSAGDDVAIATLSAIHGSSPRRLGAQMAVTSDGRFIGSISSGCLERAIVEEAQAALKRGNGSTVRYGAGSRYLDITLPCGSGMDIMYSTGIPILVLEEALLAVQSRQPFALSISENDVKFQDTDVHDDDVLIRPYQPPLQIAVAGVGVELILFTRMAIAAGYCIYALSPDEKTLEQCSGKTVLLKSTALVPDLGFDQWTAFVSLFHDREWELALLQEALKSSSFYLGAVGSKKTSAERLFACRNAGIDDAALAKLKGPIGLVPATRDPSALAVSVLAEIVAAWPH